MALVDIVDVHEMCYSFGCIPDGALCAEKSYASGDGLKFARIGEPIAVTVHPMDTQNKEYTKQVKVTAELSHCRIHDQSSDVIHDIQQQSKSQYTVTYQPSRSGRHTLQLCVDGNNLRDSPFTVSVLPTLDFFHKPKSIIGDVKKPTGVTTNSKGNIIVVEQGAHCVSVFTTDLDKVLFGSQGSNVGQFQSLQAVAVDKDDNIYITDSGNHRLQKFTSNGRFI